MINKLTPKFNLPKTLAMFFVCFILLCLFLGIFSSCNSIKRAERKALEPYNKVLSDVDTSHNKKKQDLLAAIVDSKMPNKSKKETIIKYLPGKIIRDTAETNKLRKQIANELVGKKCLTPTQMDSIIAYFVENTPPITIHDTVSYSEKETIIDTTGNKKTREYIESLITEIQQQKHRATLAEDSLKKCQNELSEKNKELDEIVINEAKISYSAKLFFGNLWDSIKWWLLAIAVLYGIYRLLKLRFKLPF